MRKEYLTSEVKRVFDAPKSLVLTLNQLFVLIRFETTSKEGIFD